jgi:hypothetical protein
MRSINPQLRPTIKRVFNNRTGEFEWQAIPVHKYSNWKGISETPWADMAFARNHADKLNAQEKEKALNHAMLTSVRLVYMMEKLK